MSKVYWNAASTKLSTCQVYASRAVVMTMLPMITPQWWRNREGMCQSIKAMGGVKGHRQKPEIPLPMSTMMKMTNTCANMEVRLPMKVFFVPGHLTVP